MSVWLRRVNGWLTVLCAVLLRGSRHRQPWTASSSSERAVVSRVAILLDLNPGRLPRAERTQGEADDGQHRHEPNTVNPASYKRHGSL
jgi:hypothetical protein